MTSGGNVAISFTLSVLWHVTHDAWHLTGDKGNLTWHVTPDIWHLTCDTWHLTSESLHLTLGPILALNVSFSDIGQVTPDTWRQVKRDTWHLTLYTLQMTHDPWHVTPDTRHHNTWNLISGRVWCFSCCLLWHMTHYRCHITHDTWHITHDKWHVTSDTMTHDYCFHDQVITPLPGVPLK